MNERNVMVVVAVTCVVAIGVACAVIFKPGKADATASVPAPAVVAKPVSVATAAPPQQLSAPVAPVATPPKPFRGVNWGCALAGRSDMGPADYQPTTVNVDVDENRSIDIKNLHTKSYVRFDEKRQFGPENVGAIHYVTFDDRFYKVEINDVNPFKLSAVFSEVYGPAKESKVGDSRHWSWEVDNGQTHISMLYSPPDRSFPNGFTVATITNVTLEKELTAIQKTEAIAELNKARKDF